MSKTFAPLHNDKARSAVINRITSHFDQLYELSAAKQGKKNPITSRDAVIEKYKFIHEAESKAYAVEGVFRFILTEPYEPTNPSIPIEKLKKIQVRDLIVGKRHKGTYIIVKIVAKAHLHEFAVDAIFEDEGGSYGILRVYFLDDENDYGGSIPKNQLIIVRDPYFWDSGNGALFVRVDHPSDMQFLHSWDEASEKLVPSIWKCGIPFDDMSAAHLVGLADLYVDAEDWEAALQKYNWADQRVIKNKGVEVHKNVLLRLYMGRAEVNTRLQRYYLTVGDIENALKVAPDNEDALHLRALRLYYTGKYDACQQEIKRLLEKYPNRLKFTYLGRRAKERFEEARFGRYNWKAMRQKAAALDINLDHAEFNHLVKLKKTPKGRRIFTARDVKRGDLLMVAKAIAVTPFEDPHLCVQLAPRGGKIECEFGCSASFDLDVLGRVKREGPEWYEKVFCLMDDGGYPPSPYRNPDGSKVIDAFHIEAVRRRNAIVISNLPLLQHRSSGYMACSPAHLPRVMSYNCGMWYLPSFLRHSCVPNAHRSVIGDMLIVRAGCDIPKDTKVTVSCSTPSNWEFPLTDFVCTCPAHTHDVMLCGDLNNRENKEKLKSSIWREFNTTCQFIEAAKSKPEKWMKIDLFNLLLSMIDTLDKIKTTLPPSDQIPQVQLAHRYRYIAAAYYGSGQRRHARCAYYKVLDCLAVEFVIFEAFDTVIWTSYGQCTEDLLHTYCDLAELALSTGIRRCWRDAAVDVYEILFGERASFDSVMQQVPFIEMKDQCHCVGVDDFMDADELQLHKRMGLNPKKEEEICKTVDGLAMKQIMDRAAKRACDLISSRTEIEYKMGAEKMVAVIQRREKEMERRKQDKESKKEGQKLGALEKGKEKEKDTWKKK
ncbi:hypothetical protein TWF730_002722 [Orbilia blumenaviensis]|uniref:SET domain-containing protein n=1 Tax=Orbilia blumenaviensis TaxID=1796055 RepID=A0AAV9U6P6_9PEZI